jgi:hypothetical protein
MLAKFIQSSRGENGTPNAQRLFPAGTRKTRTFDSTTLNALLPAPFLVVPCEGSDDYVGDLRAVALFIGLLVLPSPLPAFIARGWEC